MMKYWLQEFGEEFKHIFAVECMRILIHEVEWRRQDDDY